MKAIYCKRNVTSATLCEPCIKKDLRGYLRMSIINFRARTKPRPLGICSRCGKAAKWEKQGEEKMQKLQETLVEFGMQKSYVETLEVTERVRNYGNTTARKFGKKSPTLPKDDSENKGIRTIQEPPTPSPTTSSDHTPERQETTPMEFVSWDAATPIHGRPDAEYIGIETPDQEREEREERERKKAETTNKQIWESTNHQKTNISEKEINECISELYEYCSQGDFSSEIKRRKTFREWRCPFFTGEQMAAEGFIYTGILDRVRCFDCNTEICRWGRDDNLREEHKKWSRNCKFLRGESTNIPIPRYNITEIGTDVCGWYERARAN